jgi:hypothetical protein
VSRFVAGALLALLYKQRPIGNDLLAMMKSALADQLAASQSGHST